MVNEERCSELREALNAIRAQASSPIEDLAVHGALGVTFAPYVATAPVLPSDFEQQIQQLEQSLREEGCEAD